MARYRSIPQYVEAVQWFVGVELEGAITDPKACVGVAGIHIGHQRELDGTNALVLAGDNWEIIGESDWVVFDGNQVRVYSDAHFCRLYEPTNSQEGDEVR